MVENIIVGVIVVVVIAVGVGAWWYENCGQNEETDEAGNTINMDKSERNK